MQVVKRNNFLSSFSISIVLNFIFLPFWLVYSIKSNIKEYSGNLVLFLILKGKL